MEALKEMVRMKGGRDKLGDDSFIQTLLSWQENIPFLQCGAVTDDSRADTTSATLARSRPRFPLAITNTSDPGSKLVPNQSPPFNIGEVFGLIDELRNLTDLKKIIDSNDNSTIPDILAFDAQRNALEEKVLCLQFSFSTRHDLGFGDIFLDACCIAASIYMNIALRNFRPYFPNLRTLKQDLTTAILKAEALYASLADLPESGFPYAESLVWVLFIGGSLASDASETTWFANRMALVVPWTQVRSWDEAETCLKRMLWVDKLRNDACNSLWSEVERTLGFNSEKILAMGDDIVESSVPLESEVYP